MRQEDMVKAERALIRQDPVLGKVIKSQKLVRPVPRSDYFHSLSRSIIGQQISVVAAASIFTRFEAATNLRPEKYLKLTPEEVRAIGLSKQKAGYIGDLAQHFFDDPNIYNHLEKQSDEQVIAELTEIKGIGKWTAQAFLIFTLSRPDVFMSDDVGLQRAIIKLYDLATLPPKSDLEAITEKWRPYRTVASLNLWHSLHNSPA